MGLTGREYVNMAMAVVIIAVVTAGCLETADDSNPPIFDVKMDYWRAGEFVVVNVTLTNVANFTPGNGTLDPHVTVSLDQWNASASGGGLTRAPGSDVVEDVSLTFSSGFNEPWRDRYYSWDAADRLGISRQEANPGDVGPMLIQPEESVNVTFVLLPDYNYSDREGYYTIQVRPLADYPDGEIVRPVRAEGSPRIVKPEIYHSGCFNHNVSPFYGVRAEGPNCQYWSCTGRRTSTELAVRNGKERPPPKYQPECDGMNATGPFPGEDWYS